MQDPLIENELGLESALEEATALLAHPPRPGSPEDDRLAALLRAIEAYRPQVAQVAQEDPRRARIEALERQASELESRVAQRKAGGAMDDVDALISPFTGRDAS